MFLTAQGWRGLWSSALWWWAWWAAPSLSPILNTRSHNLSREAECYLDIREQSMVWRKRRRTAETPDTDTTGVLIVVVVLTLYLVSLA